MREIGGYIEFEQFHKEMLHESAIKLNCGRNCLAYLIKMRGITSIALPYFLCESVKNICKKYNVNIRYYSLKDNLMPEDLVLKKDEWLYVVNYYGQIDSMQVKGLSLRYEHIIVDYAQAYFDKPIDGVDSIYTCRKFFGVPDGAFLYTDSDLPEPIERDESFERMHFLLGRYERSASEFYNEYVANNQIFTSQPIKYMSKLTQNLLRSIDYNQVRMIRTENYTYLASRFHDYNLLNIQKVEGAFAYPLMLKEAQEVRCHLIRNKVYIPVLWPNVINEVNEESYEYQLANSILPLPVDQRYRIEDMEYMAELICKVVWNRGGVL
ncbi:hypothetical protein [Enterocloster bolteae]|uniref:hypothetical protein n=1 Tax=Enterocloster bolteae TaxID=208479 RepID=UPI0028DC8CE0|nr:hypothetical protein [Enterocloster bolteae]